MKELLNLKNVAITVLIIVILLQYCNPSRKLIGETVRVDGKKYELIKHQVDTVDIIKTKVVIKKGEDIYHETIIEKKVNIPIIIDTQALLKDFFAKNVYRDTLTLPDSLGTVSVIDTITQNKLLGRTFNTSIIQRTVKETTIVKELPKTQIYYGFNGGFNKTDVIANVGAGVIIKTKRDKIYQLGAGVANRVVNGTNGSLTPYISVGLYWKIKFKK